VESASRSEPRMVKTAMAKNMIISGLPHRDVDPGPPMFCAQHRLLCPQDCLIEIPSLTRGGAKPTISPDDIFPALTMQTQSSKHSIVFVSNYLKVLELLHNLNTPLLSVASG
jgi:hypothetical protein